MVAFTDRLIEANRTVWAAMAGHTFVLGLARGSLPDSALQAWVQQDRVFVVEERRVVAALRAQGLPSRLDEFAGAPSPALGQRLGLLSARAARFELAFWEMRWRGQAWPA